MVGASIAFGLAGSVWVLYAARFGQGVGSAVSWTGGLAWLVAAAPRARRGEVIGVAMGAAVVGALLGPVLGGAAALVGTAPAFGGVALAGLVLAAWAAATPASRPARSQPLRSLLAAVREQRVAGGIWLVSLAAILLGVVTVLAPLRLDELGWGALGISAAFFVGAGFQALLNPFLGR
jgi:MFS family permease